MPTHGCLATHVSAFANATLVLLALEYLARHGPAAACLPLSVQRWSPILIESFDAYLPHLSNVARTPCRYIGGACEHCAPGYVLAGTQCMPLHLANAMRPPPPPPPASAPVPGMALLGRPTAAVVARPAPAPAPAHAAAPASAVTTPAPAGVGAPEPPHRRAAGSPPGSTPGSPPGSGFHGGLAPRRAGALAPSTAPAPAAALKRGSGEAQYHAHALPGAPLPTKPHGPSLSELEAHSGVAAPAYAVVLGQGYGAVQPHSGIALPGAPPPATPHGMWPSDFQEVHSTEGSGFASAPAAAPGYGELASGAPAPGAIPLGLLQSPNPNPSSPRQQDFAGAAPAPMATAAAGLSFLQRRRSDAPSLPDAPKALNPNLADGPSEAGGVMPTPAAGPSGAGAQRGVVTLHENSQSSPAALAPPGVATWVSQRTGLAVGLALAAAGLLVALTVLACCLLRANRRHQEGRDGGGWGAALLPTPSPLCPRRASPLHLREKFRSAPSSPGLQGLAEALAAKETQSAACQGVPNAWSPISMGSGRIPPRPTFGGALPAASGASSSAAASGSTMGVLACGSGAHFTLSRLVAADISSVAAVPRGTLKPSVEEVLRETAAVEAAGALTFNPAFALDPRASSGSSGGSSQRRDVLPASAAMSPAESSEGSHFGHRMRARSLFQELGPGEAATPMRDTAPAVYAERTPGGLPRLPLTPGTAKRLRRPTGSRARKENAPSNARPPATRSPPSKCTRTAGPTASTASSPANPALPPPGVSDSPDFTRTPDSEMLRTGPAAALSLDNSRSPAGAGVLRRGGGELPLSPLRPAAAQLPRMATAPAETPEPLPPAAADATPERRQGSTAHARRRLQEQGLRASDSVLTAGGAGGTPAYVASPDGAGRRAGSDGAGETKDVAESGAGSAGPAPRQSGPLLGAGPRYRVVMFHQYPRDLLRGWLRQHHIREEEVEFRVLPGATGS